MDKLEYTVADVLMDIHDRQGAFFKADTMEIVSPMSYFIL